MLLNCWRRLLRVPWTARRSNPSILEQISPGCSLEGMMLKLKLQYFGHLMRRVDSLEKTLMLGGMGAGGEGDNRGWDGWMAQRLDGHESEWTPGVGDGQGGLVCCNSWGRKELDRTERLSWTEPNHVFSSILFLFLAMPHDLWDLSPPTRDWPWPLGPQQWKC